VWGLTGLNSFLSPPYTMFGYGSLVSIETIVPQPTTQNAVIGISDSATVKAQR